MHLRICDVDYQVEISGPGQRTEIFLQGCYQNCEGCFNQMARPLDGGKLMPIDDVILMIHELTPNKLVTFCGGEPLVQAYELSMVATMLKLYGFHILVYTGLTYEEIHTFVTQKNTWNEKILGKLPRVFTMDDYSRILIAQGGIIRLLDHCDILVDGPFMKDKVLPIESGKFIGSSNQRAIDVSRTLTTQQMVFYDWQTAS